MARDFRLLQRDYLLAITRAMNTRRELQEVLALVIRSAVELTNGRAGAIALRDEDGTFHVVAHERVEPALLAALDPLLADLPLATPGAAAGRGLPFQSAVERMARRLPPRYAQLLALPLISDGAVSGLLLIFRSHGAALFTPLDGELVEVFTDQAAIAIRNAGLYDALSRQAETLRLLYDFSLQIVGARDVEPALEVAAAHIRRIGPYDWTAIVYRGEGEESRSARLLQWPAAFLAEPRARLALERRSSALASRDGPVTFDDLEQNEAAPPMLAGRLGALVALPIRGRERPLGVLWLGRRAPIPFDPAELRLLTTIVQPLGLVLDTFTLLDRLQRRERQLSTIVEHSPAGVLLLDGDGRVRTFNPIVALLTGRRLEAVRGEPVGQVLQLDDEQGRARPLVLPTAPGSSRLQGYVRRLNGQRGSYVQVSTTALDAPTGGAGEGYVVSLVDLSALREAEQAKQIFLAGLSHELKTPLAIIRGYAETLRHPEIAENPALNREALEVILEETGRLTQMVDQMLLAARIEAGVVDLALDDLAPGPFVKGIVETFRQAYPDYRWQVETDARLPLIRGDRARLREVLENLLSNAVKYSDSGGAIVVEARARPDALLIHVTDEGIGIAAEAQSRLFDRFFRATDRAEGSGLGLYISRAIAEAHGGRIDVMSEAGQGSRFTLLLPAPAARTEVIRE